MVINLSKSVLDQFLTRNHMVQLPGAHRLTLLPYLATKHASVLTALLSTVAQPFNTVVTLFIA